MVFCELYDCYRTMEKPETHLPGYLSYKETHFHLLCETRPSLCSNKDTRLEKVRQFWFYDSAVTGTGLEKRQKMAPLIIWYKMIFLKFLIIFVTLNSSLAGFFREVHSSWCPAFLPSPIPHPIGSGHKDKALISEYSGKWDYLPFLRSGFSHITDRLWLFKPRVKREHPTSRCQLPAMEFSCFSVTLLCL